MSSSQPVFRGAGCMPSAPLPAPGKAPPAPKAQPKARVAEPKQAKPKGPTPSVDKAKLKMAASEKVNASGIEDFQKWAAEEAETIDTLLHGQSAASSSAGTEGSGEYSKKVFKRQRQQANKDILRDPTDQEVMDYMKAAEE